MNRNYKWQIGQLVKTKDEDTGEIIKGILVDKASDCIYIQWEGLKYPTLHFPHEYELLWKVT